MGKRIRIDPITRLEGHGKIDVILDDAGNVERAVLQVPNFAGSRVSAKRSTRVTLLWRGLRPY